MTKINSIKIGDFTDILVELSICQNLKKIIFQLNLKIQKYTECSIEIIVVMSLLFCSKQSKKHCSTSF